MANSEYNLTVVDGTALTISLSGPAGPVGPAGPAGTGGGSSTISTSTLTTLTGYIYGNGTAIAGATAATSANTANTLVLRDVNGRAVFSRVGVYDFDGEGPSYITVVDGTYKLGDHIELNPNDKILEFLSVAVGATPNYYTFPNTSGTVALTDVAQTFSGAQTFTNASIKLSTIPEYANNSAAAAASLPNGSIYKTSTGELRIKVP